MLMFVIPKIGSWWRHQIETFSALLTLCTGNSTVTGEFPSQRPMMWSFNIFFDMCLNKQFNKHWDACDLRRHHAHYVITVMHCSNKQQSYLSSCARILGISYCSKRLSLMSNFNPWVTLQIHGKRHMAFCFKSKTTLIPIKFNVGKYQTQETKVSLQS